MSGATAHESVERGGIAQDWCGSCPRGHENADKRPDPPGSPAWSPDPGTRPGWGAPPPTLFV